MKPITNCIYGIWKGTEEAVTGPPRKRLGTFKVPRGFESHPFRQFICVTGEKNTLRNVRGKRVCIIADIIKSARDGLLVRIQRNAPTRWAEHLRYLKIRPKGFKRSENG